MPLDAICLRALTNELRDRVCGARIDKVQQPARDQIVLLLRGNLRLLINAGPNQPRIQLTEELRENPAEPPMLCMLLRKHLVGGRIASVEQSGLERVVTLDISNTNELGEAGVRRLVFEAIGRRANLILLDGDGRIVECMRRVETELSGARALLPGLFYRPPAPLERLSILASREEALETARRGGEQGEPVERFCLADTSAFRRLLRASWLGAPSVQRTHASDRRTRRAAKGLPMSWHGLRTSWRKTASHRPCC